MLVSYRWICEIAGFSSSPEELGDRLTFCGLEVDELRSVGDGFDDIVVGVIKSRESHPTAKKLHCVTVDSGSGVVSVVCGAPNCPGPGSRVVLARVGAVVGDITIESREIAGAPSEGMLCSEMELDIGPDQEGIMILDGETEAAAGTPVADAFDLQDWIYSIGITPNRPDALSHRGIAREMALLYGKPFDPQVPEAAPEDGDPVGELIKVDLIDPEGCPRYAAAVITGVKVGISPFSLRYRLHNLGVRPISNLVDVTNLILLEYGQPLHAFDLDRVADARIVVRRASDGERMKTLDEVERTFTGDDLLICDGERPVAVAGVMGGLDTGITQETRNLLIECAYFNPSMIRRTSKRLKLASESSYRFERGIDPNMAGDVLRSTAGLMCGLAGGAKAPGLVDCYPVTIERKRVALRPGRYESVMGYPVGVKKMCQILEGLGAVVTGVDDEISVLVPTNRPDIEREIDLIEEIARVVGLDKIPSLLPRIRSCIPDREEYEAAMRVRQIMVSLGLEESISYSFVPEEMLAGMGLGDRVVNIANPLNSKRAAMRTTLLAGLIENLKRATTRYVGLVCQFEVGRTFHDEGGELPLEVRRVAAVMSGSRDSWVGEDNGSLDFYDAKGIAGAFIKELTGMDPAFEPVKDLDYMHPNRALRVLADGEDVGVVGEVHPKILTGQKLGRGAVGFEVDVMRLWGMRRRSAATPLHEFPPMVRDVAFLVEESRDAASIEDALREACAPLATNVSLFDVYRGKGIEYGKKSLAFSVWYRSREKTLTDEEVDAIHRTAIDRVKSEFGVRTR